MQASDDHAAANAVVIGASMAGLLAARALADHFERVTLLERDTFPPAGEQRKGVPQGKHTHALLERGRRVMESAFPGLTKELIELGAVRIDDVSANVRWFHGGAHHKPGCAGFSSIAISRPVLEATVRRRVLRLPNVQALEGCNVRELMAKPGDDRAAASRRVTGVRFVRRLQGRNRETMKAGLVVDAGGRGSRGPAWLQQLGYRRPAVDEMRIGMGYVTCHFGGRSEYDPDVQGVLTMATPPGKRLAVFLPQEGNRWVLTIGGYLGDHAPTDQRGFLEASRQLPSPYIYNYIKDAEPLHEPVAYNYPANRRRRYDLLPSFPQGYLPIGDALCSFNPIYGQGMTVAALEADALGECLAQQRGDLAKRYFARVGQIVDAAWSAAVGNDLRIPEVQGARTPTIRFFNWYLERLHVAAHSDAQVSIAFLHVLHMLSPPTSLLHPQILWRVLKGNLRPGRHAS